MKLLFGLSIFLFGFSSFGASDFYSHPGTRSSVDENPYVHFCHSYGSLTSISIRSELSNPSEACAQNEMIAGVATPRLYECRDDAGKIVKLTYSSLARDEACEL